MRHLLVAVDGNKINITCLLSSSTGSISRPWPQSCWSVLAERSGSLHPWDIQKPSGHGPGQPFLGCLDQMTSRTPFQPQPVCDSVNFTRGWRTEVCDPQGCSNVENLCPAPVWWSSSLLVGSSDLLGLLLFRTQPSVCVGVLVFVKTPTAVRSAWWWWEIAVLLNCWPLNRPEENILTQALQLDRSPFWAWCSSADLSFSNRYLGVNWEMRRDQAVAFSSHPCQARPTPASKARLLNISWSWLSVWSLPPATLAQPSRSRVSRQTSVHSAEGPPKQSGRWLYLHARQWYLQLGGDFTTQSSLPRSVSLA